MNAAERREDILNTLKNSSSAVSATALAGRLHVSRQIIVGDVALLRAGGEDIIATPRGYIINVPSADKHYKIACTHSSSEMRDELYIMVDHGCYVEDVIVEHPIYGQLVGQLELATRADVDEFLQKVKESDAMALSDLTGGLHIHTLRCPSEAAYQKVVQNLADHHILVSDQ